MKLAEPGLKIVVRYLDGRVEKHTCKRQVAVTASTFRFIDEHNKVTALPLADLKAVFFVKDLAGNPQYEEQQELTKDSPKVGYVVTVTFRDGEVVAGRSLNPTFGDNGFYMEPADARSNNSRIFVIRQNVAKVEVTSGHV